MNPKKLKIIRTSTVSGSLYSLLKGQLKLLNQYYEIIAVSHDSGNLDLLEKREGIKSISINMERKISPFRDLVSLWDLYRCFKKEKPDAVHSITPKAGFLTMVAGYLANVPVRMHTFTGLIFPTEKGIKQKILIAMDKILCKCATNIYPEGKGVQEDLVNYGITRKPLKIIGNGNVNGIDTDFFDPKLFSQSEIYTMKKDLGISENDYVFIFVGRMVRDKGLNELISCFRSINTLYPSTKLLLVGEMKQRFDKLDADTEKEIISNPHILSVGYQKDVRPYFALSDVLVFPSYREGFPNVVMQSGAMELPSIVTDINGCNEIILDQENGFIIQPKNKNQLQEKMEYAYLHQDEMSKIGKHSREMIRARYEQNYLWSEILSEYQRVLGQ